MTGLEILGLVISGISTAVGIAGTISAGNTAEEIAQYEAQQLEIKANEARAVGQRKAEDATRDKNFVLSRQRSTAAKSGFGALDESVLQLMGDVEEEGTRQKLTDRAIGENRGRGFEDAATIRRVEGRAEKRAALFDATGQALKFGSSMFFSKYGDGGFGGEDDLDNLIYGGL